MRAEALRVKPHSSPAHRLNTRHWRRALDSLHLGFSARDEEDARLADEEVRASDNKASPVV